MKIKINEINLSKYHLTIISFYLLIYIHYFYINRGAERLFNLDYGFVNSLLLLFILFPLSILAFFVVNYFIKYGEFKYRKVSFLNHLLILFYSSMLIAIPEEILFRGYVEGFLSDVFQSSFVVTILSAVIFGFAHILNGAKSVRLRDWNWKLAVLTFFAGIFLSTGYHVTESLLVPVVLHVLLLFWMKIFVRESLK